MRQLTAFIIILILSLVTPAFAEELSSVEFFASNNTTVIDQQTAYQRLKSDEQHKLQNSMTDVLQKNHIEQGKFEDILGTYRMADNGNITADNTDVFTTSPYQHVSEQKIFSIAQQFASAMKQESVAVFIPSQQPIIGELKISFTTHKPNIKEVDSLIHDKLPPPYNQAFSLHLMNEYDDFENVKVAEVEWLGSKMNINDIENAFPSDKVTFQYGKAYLVYKDGKKEQL